MTKIYLVRHGQASAGTDNYDRLSEIGKLQAKLLGQHWKKSGFRPTCAYAGTLERQQDTAAIALENAGLDVPIVTVPELNEYDHTIVDTLFGEGMASDMPDTLQLNDYCQIMARWRDARREHLQQHESWSDFSNRGWAAIQESLKNTAQENTTQQPAPNHVYFTSGGVIATVLQQLLALSFDKTMEKIWYLNNASVSTLRLESDRKIVVNINTTSHLDTHYDSRLLTQI